MTRALVILGTGGRAYEILDIIEAINAREPSWKVLGFLDDAKARGSRHLGFEVLGSLGDATRLDPFMCVNSIGSEKNYIDLPEILAATRLLPTRFATLVHPLAAVSSRARLGHGVVVNHGVSVSGGVRIGHHVTLSAGCVIGHDCTIEDYSIMAPGSTISGFVNLGRACYLGAGSVVRQRVNVGEFALVGMGSVVLKSVNSGEVVVGNPARLLRNIKNIRLAREA
ncbi:acetyltransferase [Singulisphaera sp. PoT]|uniref:acetyltransferase n=1 Tax=Singulisphaera sp. PoT TaxID=3411797 RepID=UPI003BF59BAA